MQRHQDGVVLVIGLEHLEMDIRVMMTRKADKPAFPGFLGGLKRLNRTTRTENLGDFFLFIDRMNLPEVEVICF